MMVHTFFLPIFTAAKDEKYFSIFATSQTDRQFLRQKVRQRISVTKTNTGVFVGFKTKCELKCQFSGITEIL